ncbi:MAG: DUF4352 domain-containing protein [Acidimicrobiia bacterium]|nr:DUF4352 domain-containing protein [Acidimicrobiia bacterium]
MPATKVGTEGNDFLLGTEGVDVIVGLGGNDIIRGLGGNDYLCGGNGRDRLFGGFGNDYLEGGKKNDIIKGDQGRDQLFGNQGNDRLFGGPGRDVLEGGSGVRDKLFGKGSWDVCNDPQGTTIYDGTCEEGDGAGVGDPAPPAANIGSTIRLEGFGDDVTDFTIHQIVDPATPASDFTTPDAGNRWVSVLVGVRPVVGDYNRCLQSILELRGSNGALEDAFNYRPISEGPDIGCMAIRQGDRRVGWLTFELPNGVQPTRLEGNINPSKPTVQLDLLSGSATTPSGAVTFGALRLGVSVPWEYLGDAFTVRVSEVVDPATPSSQFNTPDAGNRLVAVRVSVRNDNTTAERVSGVDHRLLAVTAEGFAYPSVFKETTSGEDLPFDEIAPGATQGGWVVFEVPNNRWLTKFSLAGLGGDTGISEWRAR